MAEYVTVAQLKGIPQGTMKLVEVSSKKIALANIGGIVYAFDDVCPHRQGPLSRGKLEAEIVTCPWHSSKFNVRTGAVVGPPATVDIKTYKVQVAGDDVKLERPV